MEEIDWDNLPPTTAPEVQVRVLGFSNQDAAMALAQAVGDCVVTLGRFMDLSTLDGVTVGFDYDEALAAIDQGYDAPPLGRTNTEELQGVAKTCTVVRGDLVKSHLVFGAAPIVALIADEKMLGPNDLGIATGIIAHECGHVDINAQMAAAIPDSRHGALIQDYKRAVLFQVAEICWSEYAVCRLSARFAPHQNEQHAESLSGVLKTARAQSVAGVASYRFHGDLRRLLEESGTASCQPMKVAAYLLGGLDAVDGDWSQFPEVRREIEEAGYATLVDNLHEECRRLWEHRGRWSETEDVFGPLCGLIDQVFRSAGIFISSEADGRARIDVPF